MKQFLDDCIDIIKWTGVITGVIALFSFFISIFPQLISPYECNDVSVLEWFIDILGLWVSLIIFSGILGFIIFPIIEWIEFNILCYINPPKLFSEETKVKVLNFITTPFVYLEKKTPSWVWWGIGIGFILISIGAFLMEMYRNYNCL